MSTRRRRNAIQMIQVNGVQVQGVLNIRETVFSHLSSHFKVTQVERPGVENMVFLSAFSHGFY